MIIYKRHALVENFFSGVGFRGQRVKGVRPLLTLFHDNKEFAEEFERAALPEPAGMELMFRDGLFFIKPDVIRLQDATGLEIKSSDFVYLKPKDRLLKDGTILWEVTFK